jgi:DNA-binding CsgD family transcriptional regulator
MTIGYPHFNASPASPLLNSAVEQLSRLQIDLMSDALRRAVDDVGAAMKHQLSEPLTALLLYLYEIKRAGAFDAAGSSAALGEIVDRALCEIERVCNIIGQVGEAVEASVDAEAAIAHGASNNRVRVGVVGSPTARTNAHRLTPREQEVLALITGGCSNKEGGYQLGISTRTFEAHRAHLMGKLGARNAADLIRMTSNRDQ